MDFSRDEGVDGPTAQPVARRLARLVGWQQRLLRAVRAQELLILLGEFGLTDRDLARASAGKPSTRTLRRWKAEGPPESRADERWEQLDDLRAIIGYMLADGTFDEEGIVAWLRSRHPSLEMQRPLDVLGEGRFMEVLRAAEGTLGPTASGERGAIRAAESATDVAHQQRDES